jgi:hypothetical protein
MSKHRIRKGKVAILAAAALVLGVGSLLAVPNIINALTTSFELGPGAGTDENGLTNILDQSGDGVPDWAGLFNASGGFIGSSGTGVFLKDDVSAGSLVDNTVYSGGPGDKNSDEIAHWTWSSSSVPAKDDISNSYVYTKFVNGEKLLYVGVEREDPSGDSHIDFEFFQEDVALDHDPPCPIKQCGFTKDNKDGDILVNMDFSRGGGFGTLSVRKRKESLNNHYELLETLTGEGCTNDDAVCGFNNGGAIDGGVWDNFDNHGAIITTLQTNSFTEFALNITKLVSDAPCFASVEVKTRSSTSFTAALKDFSLHGFEPCLATAATEIHQGASVGATHTGTNYDGGSLPSPATVHDKAIITGVLGQPTPTGNVVFKRFTTIDCTGTSTDETVALSEMSAPTSSVPGKAAAESSTFVKTTGTLSYLVSYTPPIGSGYQGTATASCESLTVTINNSSVSTVIRKDNVNGNSVLNTAIDVSGTGTTVVDVATVTGNGTVDPTGTVTFKAYPTANCSGNTFTTETVNVSIGTVGDGISTATSGGKTFNLANSAAGSFLCYVVSYSGDSNYQSSVDVKVEPLCAFPFVP